MSLDAWRTLFSGATLISVVFVALNYWLARNKAKTDSELAQDKEICGQSILALERAFQTLSGSHGTTTPPEASRLNWLTTSRQILRFKKLKATLRTQLYRTVCSEHEEHWRHQFFLLLEHRELLNPSYFQVQNHGLFTSENIYPKSALVIFNFKQWDPQQEDTLDEIDKDEIINDRYTLNGLHGFSRYIAILSEERVRRKGSS